MKDQPANKLDIDILSVHLDSTTMGYLFNDSTEVIFTKKD